MSFAELMENLETLTPEQRELVIQRASKLDEPEFCPEVLATIEQRLSEHHRDPGSSISHEEFNARLQDLRQQ